jgi:glyceraldehyde 3-phosphate dehydrogenase
MRLAINDPSIEVGLVNDLADIKTLAHLLKYDSVHRQYNVSFEIKGDFLEFSNGKKVFFTNYENPHEIPWGKYNVQTVIESSGKFLTKQEASGHLSSGARKVILSAPSKSEEIKTIVIGVNDNLINNEDVIISNASCTTNNAAPMVKVMLSLCEIESAYITTVHSFTTDQKLHDAPHNDLRRARAATQSIVPTSTGAAKAITKIFPELDGKIGGCGVRVPVPDGSFTDITMVVKNPPTVNDINRAMRLASEGELKGILTYTEDPIVSVDVIGNPSSCVFDAGLTSVINNMVKVVGWYDNEAGYSNRLIDLVKSV